MTGETLFTGVQNKPFTVEVEGSALWFIPGTTGKRRKANPVRTELVLSQLNKTGIYSPSQYIEITRHASYILAVAYKFQQSQPK